MPENVSVRLLAIVVRFSNDEVVLRYYLDRKPTNFDHESINVVAANLDAGSSQRLKKLDVECVFFGGPLSKADPVNGFFLRKT